MAELTGYYGDEATDIEQYGSIRIAQTFTLSQAAVLSDIEILVLREGSPGTISVSLYSVSGGEPDSSIRIIGFSGDALTTNAAGEWKTITYSGGQAVSAGQYAIVISGGNDAGNSIHWRVDDTTPSYSGGQRLHSTDSGSSWTPYSGYDFSFKVNGEYAYVFTPPSGKPTTKRLVACAASAFWYEDV